jgi:hypothetical protein
VEAAVLVKRLVLGQVTLAAALVARSGSALPTKDECINANESAQSVRTAGKLREAVRKLTLCTAATCPGPVRDDCAERLNEVQRALPTVVFDVRDAGGSDLVAVRVSMDGAVIASKLDGSAVAVDPGEHTFAFTAEGLSPLEESLVIREGDKARVVRVVLSRPGARGHDGAVPTVPTAPAPDGTEKPSSTTRTGAYVALGVGAAGVAVGALFGTLALIDKVSLGNHCSGTGCPPSEQSDIDGLHTNATVANVAFGIGLVGLATATVLFLVSHQPEPAAGTSSTVRPWVGLGGAGVWGTFQ